MTFSDDIKSKDTNLYPVVVIDKDGENEIRISTNSTTIGGQYYSPILLNVPGLKESIDVSTRRYKISNVSLSISNYEHDGSRFSETVGDNSLINQSVDIYWVSPSAYTIPSIPLTDAEVGCSHMESYSAQGWLEDTYYN